MHLRFSKQEEEFRKEISEWLKENLKGKFKSVIGRGGSGDQTELFKERVAWEQHMGRSGWTCISWPKEFGGRGASINEQVIFYEEYTKAGGPGRIGHIGETLAGPTIISFGTQEQQERFLPKIKLGEEYWCQGYSEPSAGSDLSAIKTKAELVKGKWKLNGQKIWTSLAKESNWIFVLCRSTKRSSGREGLSYILVPIDQPGITIRPIKQITGQSEFNEVFFEDAEADIDHVVGEVGNDNGLQIFNGESVGEPFQKVNSYKSTSTDGTPPPEEKPPAKNFGYWGMFLTADDNNTIDKS